ncbi:MAG: thioredoxin family protein [Pseudomonadota bacterium]
MIAIFQALLLATSLMFTSVATADSKTYNQANFDALQKAGKSILLEVHAPWCPTCRVQAPIINELLEEKEYQAITLLRIDFDSQKDALKKFNVSKQGTLIVFKGEKETGRSTGDTAFEKIEALVQKAL